MKVSDLVNIFQPANTGDEEKTLEGVFCCDLLSVSMGQAPAGSVWVTVMANVNTLAVASLTDVSAVVLAEGARCDDVVIEKAREQEINVFYTKEPVFSAALKVHELITK